MQKLLLSPWLVLTQKHFCKTLYSSDDGIKLFPPKWHWFSMLTVALWENLVLVVILVLKLKALYISRVQHALLLIGRFSGLYSKVQTAWLCGALSSLIRFPRDRINILLTTFTNHIFTWVGAVIEMIWFSFLTKQFDYNVLRGWLLSIIISIYHTSE